MNVRKESATAAQALVSLRRPRGWVGAFLLAVLLFTLLSTVAASAQFRTLIITPTNTIWRYFTDGTDPGAAWALPGFDDSSWPEGRGLFGDDTGYPYPFATPIPGPGRGGPTTVYFRTRFTWSGSPVGMVLVATNYFDDGVVIYLNGVELTRYNMPTGPVGHDTPAPGVLTEPVVRIHTLALDSLTNGNFNPLVAGTNVLAASVHNNAQTSSDTVFGLSLFAGQCIAPCSDGIQPTNRTVLEGRATTFTVVEQCTIPVPTFQWYRNVGAGEELILGATSNAYTLTNARLTDEGRYYCRMTSSSTSCGSGTVDSRQAVLTILVDNQPPRFLSASVVGPGLNTFRLITDEPLCGNGDPPPVGCGSDFKFQLNWQILQSDNTSIDLGVATVTQINPTTYEFTTSNSRDPSKLYQITVTPPLGEIGDLFGNLIPFWTFAETRPTLTFSQGLAGYAGTQDAEIHSIAFADTPLGAELQMLSDLDNNGVAQSLLRFDNLLGNGPNQIQFGSRISSATLTLNQVDGGAMVNLHRMLVDWNQSIVTWNSLTDGVSANDVEALSAIDATIPAGMANGYLDLDVTASVQAWVAGQANYGWVLLCTGGDGWKVNTSESGAATAPMLTVAYEPLCDCGVPVITFQPPASLLVSEFHSFAISVGVSNAFGEFQWTKDGVAIPGANSLSYSVASVTPADSGSYRFRITNPAGSVTSSQCVVTVIPDQTRPHVIRVAGDANGTNIAVVFNEPINVASSQDTANYALTPAIAVTSAVLGVNNTVTLTTAARSVGTAYSLRIANITDTAATSNLMDPNPTLVNLTSASIIAGAGWADEWRYNTNNLDATLDWKNPGFTPGPDWGTGSGLFGAETGGAMAVAPAPISTPLVPNDVTAESERRVTTYFRKGVDLPVLPAGARYVICHYTDDGFIAYLDGTEIYRFAMPAGVITFTNRSTGIPTGEATYRSFTFNATPGTHTLAVELHQAGATSPDVLFGMEVRMVGGTSPALSITRSAYGDVGLGWSGDSSWRLRGSTVLNGPYLDVETPISSRLGTFTLPRDSATNGNNFYRLDYLCRP